MDPEKVSRGPNHSSKGRMGSNAPAVEIGFAEEAFGHSYDPTDPFFPDMRLMFRRTSDGWSHLFGQYDGNYGDMLVKLTDARDEEVRKEHQLHLDFSDDGANVNLLLRDMLKHAREIKIHCGHNLHSEMTEILKTAGVYQRGFEQLKRIIWEIYGNPVPALESLAINLGPKLGYESGLRLVGYVLRPIFSIMESRKLMKLMSLKLSMVGLTHEGLRCLVDVIKAGCLPSLVNLDLSVNQFGSLGVKYLARLWGPRFLGLRSLDLSNNTVGDHGGLLALAKAMKSAVLFALETLNLSSTDMGNAGCQAFAENMSVGNLPALKNLKLQDNHIADIGVSALGHAFLSGKVRSLTYFNLHGNLIGDKGLIELVTSLTSLKLPRLEVLNLGNNKFTEKGLLFLSSELGAGKLNSLRSLKLRPNDRIFSESCAKALVSALAANSVLNCQIKFDWHAFPAQDLLRQQHQERNHTNAQMLAEFQGQVIPATFGKVYLCGNPEVGKTTLRKSLQRTKLQSMVSRERKQHEVKRTRGIEVSELISEGKQGEDSIELALWDMAGQEEYHLLHNAFFPDLASASGKATTFVVVCNPQNVTVAQQELKYWLQFIASSCGESVLNPRKVFVVLNCFKGDSKPLENSDSWEHWIEEQSHKFKDYLNIRTDPFIVDARKRTFVKHLKRCLIDHSRSMLKSEMVPKICSFIQSKLKVWREEGKQFPVLRWKEFVNKVKEMDPDQPEKTLETAAKYLNEAGVLLCIEHKEFHFGCEDSMKKLVVLDPNWFCEEVVGNMFLPYPMSSPGEHVFRLEVDKYDGSISIAKLQKFFMPLHGEWTSNHIEDLMAILVWLGLCYEGRDQKVFIPALIQLSGTHEEDWLRSTLDPSEHEECQWVMGYTVEHEENTISLAPISLWHRFQVELAKCPQFNGHVRLDNDFTVGKYDIVFTVNYMKVLICVDASKDRPTFHKIDIFVKPLWPTSRDCVDSNTKKECQVDLASSLVEILLRLWNHVCPGVEYVHRVIWPWPASHPRTVISQQNMKVKEVQEFVEKNGLGILMQWRVGNDQITREQLLSKREFNYAVQSIHRNVNLSVVRGLMKEAVELGIFPLEVFKDEAGAQEAWISRADDIRLQSCEADCKSQSAEMLQEPSTSTRDVHGGLPISKISQEVLAGFKDLIQNEVKDFIRSEVVQRLDDLKIGQGVLHDAMIQNLKETKEVRYELNKVMRAQKDVLQQVENVGKFLLEDKESSFPRFVYVGQKNSSKWVTLRKMRETMSLREKVHLHFLCEAEYGPSQGQHRVVDQEGLDVSHFKDWAQKLLPWLKVSLTVLLVSARVAANSVAPALGLLIPDFATMQQITTISHGIAILTGYAEQELNGLTKEEIRPSARSTPKSAQELRGPIRTAMTDLFGNFTPSQYEKKLGLYKVHLRREDRSFYGVVWICKECYTKYGNLVTDIG